MRDKLRCSLVYDLIADFSCFAFWRCASDTSPRNKKSALDPEYKVRKKKSIWITFDVFYLYLCPLLKLLRSNCLCGSCSAAQQLTLNSARPREKYRDSRVRAIRNTSWCVRKLTPSEARGSALKRRRRRRRTLHN